MRGFLLVVAVVAMSHRTLCQEVLSEQGRLKRQTSADQMVQNILQWLQGVYTQNSRRIRQGTLREYLPPTNTQKPRPFQPVSPGTQPPPIYGYPPSGITPQPPFPIYTNPTTGAVTGEGYPPPNNEITPPHGYPSSPQPQPPFTEGPSTGYPSGFTTQTPGYPGFTTQQPGYPGSTSQRPGFPTQPPTSYPGSTSQRPLFPTQPPTSYPGTTSQRPEFPTQPPTGYPGPGYPGSTSQRPGFPTQPPTGYPTQHPGYPGTTERPGFPTQPPTGYPTQRPIETTTGYTPTPPGFTSQPTSPGGTGYPTTQTPITSRPASTEAPYTPGPSTHVPVTEGQFTSPVATTQPSPSPEGPTTTQSPEENNVFPTVRPTEGTPSSPPAPTGEDLKHPPHIHAINVECAKDMMTINIEFNREFNGVIYSKGFYSTPDCRYVNENSELTKYTFTVSLNSCGTEFINAFDTQGQSYLENVLVIQNELGIQEVWDTVRSVRCLWEGNLKDSLSVALSVGMLSQEIVTFSGDTAMAKLDIQLGTGPFAPAASGLVKIGEKMTLVISVTGDAGFDIQVKDCRATDSSGDRVYPLTDDNGCVLKPKLFGAFQKTRNTRSSGASIIAFAFFNAFKFPDSMDLMIQCNIELCKTDCQICTEPNQQIEPGRRKRDLAYYNSTDGVTMGKHLRVIFPEELSEAGSTVLDLSVASGVCMSTQNFVLSSAIMISLLTASCLFSAFLWLRSQRLNLKI